MKHNIELTTLEFSMLLEELYHNLRICNRDNRNAKVLYEKLASEFYGEKVTVHIESSRKSDSIPKKKSLWFKFREFLSSGEEGGIY